MNFFSYLRFRCFCARILLVFHPKSLIWEIIRKRKPIDPIITKLGKDLRVRIYPYDYLGKQVYLFGMTERSQIRLVCQFLKPGMTFIDVGANFGQYTLFACDLVGPNGEVHSFEPSSRIFKELCFNVQINEFQDICTLNMVAVSDKKSHATLSKYEPGSEVFSSLGTQMRKSNSIVGHEQVKTTTLDCYISEKGIKKVDFIKMDIEGAELLALRGARELLIADNAPLLVLEIEDRNCEGFGYNATEIWDYLESLGYRLYNFNQNGQISGPATKGPTFSTNLVAIKEYHHAFFKN